MAVSGVTHFNRVSGKNGVYTGARGSEVRIDEKQANVIFIFGTASAAETQMSVAPITANIVAAYAVNQVAAVAGTYTAKHGSAGTTLVSGTQSPSVAVESASLTINSAAVTEGASLSCARAASGTTGASSVVLVISKSDAA